MQKANRTLLALMRFYIPCFQEVRRYRLTGAVAAEPRPMPRLAADKRMSLWPLTPWLALQGQLLHHSYNFQGHRTAAAQVTAARHLSRLIEGRPGPGLRVNQPDPIN